MELATERWNPELYQSSHSFVWKYGRELLAQLAPQPGEHVIIVPSLSDEDAKARFPQGWKTLRPYLRVVDLKEPAKAAE